jgi:hypothetical protein
VWSSGRQHLQGISTSFRTICWENAPSAPGLKVIRTGSTAVNADYIISATMSVANAPPGTSQIGGGWDPRYALKAIAFQYREHFALRRNPDLGQEAFLIAERDK